jgi:exonuclease III
VLQLFFRDQDVLEVHHFLQESHTAYLSPPKYLKPWHKSNSPQYLHLLQTWVTNATPQWICPGIAQKLNITPHRQVIIKMAWINPSGGLSPPPREQALPGSSNRCAIFTTFSTDPSGGLSPPPREQAPMDSPKRCAILSTFFYILPAIILPIIFILSTIPYYHNPQKKHFLGSHHQALVLMYRLRESPHLIHRNFRHIPQQIINLGKARGIFPLNPQPIRQQTTSEKEIDTMWFHYVSHLQASDHPFLTPPPYPNPQHYITQQPQAKYLIEAPTHQLKPWKDTRKHQWWLSRNKRNKLQKITNGNIPPELSMVTWNTSGSLIPSTQDFNHLIGHEPFDRPTIICLTETNPTKLRIQRAKNFWKQNGYKLIQPTPSSKAPHSTGAAILVPLHLAGFSKYKSDSRGHFTAVKWNLKKGRTILIVAIYAPQRNAPAQDLAFFTQKIIDLITEAHQKRFELIITGDYNGNLNYKLDCNQRPKRPQGENTTPWIEAILNNPTNTTLIDPWRKRHPKAKEYTYTHKQSSYRDRKDLNLVTPALNDIILETTNNLWNRNFDHEAIGVTMDLSKWHEALHTKEKHAPPAPEYAPNTDTEKWDKYRELIKKTVKAIEKSTPSTTKIITLLKNLMEAAMEAEVITFRKPPPQITYPYQTAKMKKWIKTIKTINFILYPTFPQLPPHFKKSKLTSLIPKITQHPEAFQASHTYKSIPARKNQGSQ